MARWLPILAWCSCTISFTLLILLNLAGTHIVEHGHTDMDAIFLGEYAFFSVTLPFKEIANGSASWTVHVYLNAACMHPTTMFDEETGPSVLYTGIARTFNLTPIVATLESSLSETYATPDSNDTDTDSNPTYPADSLYAPNATLNHVHMPPLRTTPAPFIFYTLALAELAVLLLSMPLVFCAEHFVLAFHLALCTGSFLSVTIATATLVGVAESHIHELTRGSGKLYVENATVDGGFLAASWGAAGAAFAAGVLLFLDWQYEVKLSGRRVKGLVRVRARGDRSSARRRGGGEGIDLR